MDEKHREILRRQRPNLRRDLEVMKLLPKLFSVLDPEDEEEVKAEPTRRKKVDKLLNILPKKGPKAFDVFVKGLQEIQPFLAAPLLRYSGIQADSSSRKFDVLKTKIRFSGKYASFKNIRFPRGNYQTDRTFRDMLFWPSKNCQGCVGQNLLD